jgi:Xaa-Pro aminopeptidase
VNYTRLKTAKVHPATDFKEIKKLIGKHRKVGYDEFSLDVNLFRKLRTRGVRFFPFGIVMRKPREIKDQHEINSMKKALKVTGSVLRGLKPWGKTEFQVAAEVDYGFRKRGALNAFETIVAAGKRSAFIHYKPQDKMIFKKDAVLVDCGARMNGYCADMTRMFCRAPERRLMAILDDVLEIQKTLIGRIKQGARIEIIDNYYKRLLDKKRYQFLHSFGHGVGLNVHEGPYKGELKAGMVLTVEPGVYIKGFGGCRIEDVILVKKNRAEVLSRLDRSF